MASEQAGIEVFNQGGEGPFVLTCEHATNEVPEEFGNLGLDDALLECHAAVQIGDKALFTDRGGMQSISLETTVPGSDLEYYKLSYRQRRYIPMTKKLTLLMRGEIAYGNGYGDNKTLPFFENFFAGGPQSIRGYAARSIGPRDSNGDALGGNAMYAGNVELLFPPPFTKGSESVRLALFFDVGSVVDTDDDLFDADELRYSTGLGLSWLSPIGALTVSYAKPLKTDRQDEEEEFQFAFGSTF